MSDDSVVSANATILRLSQIARSTYMEAALSGAGSPSAIWPRVVRAVLDDLEASFTEFGDWDALEAIEALQRMP